MVTGGQALPLLPGNSSSVSVTLAPIKLVHSLEVIFDHILLYLSDFIPILQIFKVLSIDCLNLEFLCNYGLGQLLAILLFLLVTIWDRLSGCFDISGYGALN